MVLKTRSSLSLPKSQVPTIQTSDLHLSGFGGSWEQVEGPQPAKHRVQAQGRNRAPALVSCVDLWLCWAVHTETECRCSVTAPGGLAKLDGHSCPSCGLCLLVLKMWIHAMLQEAQLRDVVCGEAAPLSAALLLLARASCGHCPLCNTHMRRALSPKAGMGLCTRSLTEH